VSGGTVDEGREKKKNRRFGSGENKKGEGGKDVLVVVKVPAMAMFSGFHVFAFGFAAYTYLTRLLVCLTCRVPVSSLSLLFFLFYAFLAWAVIIPLYTYNLGLFILLTLFEFTIFLFSSFTIWVPWLVVVRSVGEGGGRVR
jgi:hypothetical protein